MIRRQIIQQDITILLEEFPAIAILGPRQVGKTTLALELARQLKSQLLYFDLENDTDLKRMENASFLFDQYQDECTIIDEVQREPHLFTSLRPAIDKLRTPGRFLLTGSASPHLVKGVAESLAGRVAFVELCPINLVEAKKSRISQVRHWFRGGFPLALTAKSDQTFIRWAENFIRAYIERDLPMLFGAGLSEKIIRNFWYMLAGQQGGIWTAENYARALGITSPTVKRYLDFLEGAFLVRQLPAWHINTGKRMVKAPKVYIRDSGLLHVLNHIQSPKQLPLHLIVGASWEGYVIEQIYQLKPSYIDLYYYRTHNGAECDLLLVKGIKPLAAVEIKHSSNPSLSRGFYHVLGDLKLKTAYVIVPKTTTYPLDKQVKVCDLFHFLTEILPEII